uniref:Uncharacterized protein n=1 Tax=Oryza brachyantha TaxID=4533 RepID=J3LSC4_ORYBR
MVGDLVNRIDNLKEDNGIGVMWRDRLMLYQHPCFKTASELIGIILKLVLHSHTLPSVELESFISAFGRVLSWKSQACKSKRLKEMMEYKVYNKWGELKLHKQYEEDSGFSRLDMSRCALQHVVRAGKKHNIQKSARMEVNKRQQWKCRTNLLVCRGNNGVQEVKRKLLSLDIPHQEHMLAACMQKAAGRLEKCSSVDLLKNYPHELFKNKSAGFSISLVIENIEDVQERAKLHFLDNQT